MTWENAVFILFLMLFCHIMSDFGLQGILINMKQKSWWEKQEGYNDKYKYDYLVSLGIHSFCWTFCVMLPVFCVSGFKVSLSLGIVLVLHAILHGVIDDAKANAKMINLIYDQGFHLIQIFLMWACGILGPFHLV